MTRLLLGTAVFLAGCHLTVNSREPFYTEQTRTTAPELRGEWLASDSQAWIFTGDGTMSVRTYGNDGFHDTKVVPFRVAGHLYLDFSAACHNLYSVARQGRKVVLTTLAGEWLTNAIAQGQVDLPPPVWDSKSNMTFTASAAQWTTFLERHGTNAPIYGDSLELRKSPNINFIPARRQQP